MGDGQCDEINNKPDCLYDGLDCPKKSCNMKKWIGDGFCDDIINNELCDFDGGDCCGAHKNIEFCSNW